MNLDIWNICFYEYSLKEREEKMGGFLTELMDEAAKALVEAIADGVKEAIDEFVDTMINWIYNNFGYNS